MKNVLVAGGTGLVGTHLVERLVKEGSISVEASKFSKNPKKNSDVYTKYDFTNFEDCLKATRGKDEVYLCAVQGAGVAGMKKSPTSPLYPNLAIHAGLLEASVINNVKKLVWVSSSTVFHETFYPLHEDDLDLNKELFPLYRGMGGLYRYLEQLMNHYHLSTDMNVGIIRTTSVYGPHDCFEDGKSHVVPALIKRAVEKETPFVVWGNGETVRDFIYADDLAKACIMVMDKYCCGETINFSNENPTTIKEAVKEILSITGHNIDPVYDEDKPTAIPFRVLKNSKFRTLIGDFPRTDLKTGLENTIKWYRDNS